MTDEGRRPGQAGGPGARRARPGRFFMVAALGAGGAELSEDEERALKPHARHKRHQAALREAHRLAGLHGRPFAVLSSGSVAWPPEEPARQGGAAAGLLESEGPQGTEEA